MATPLSFEGTHNEDYFQVFKYMSPFMFAYVGIGLVLGLSVLGAAWGMFLTGSALNGAAIRAPRISSKNLGECIVTCNSVHFLFVFSRLQSQHFQTNHRHSILTITSFITLFFFFYFSNLQNTKRISSNKKSNKKKL